MASYDDLVAGTAEEIVAAISEEAERLALLRKRFIMALYDIGWLGVVGREWVQIGQNGLEFTQLNLRQVDVILRDLEHLGEGRTAHHVSRCDGQLNAF